MPMYEYVCEDCGVAYEVRRSMKDEPELKCGQCGSTNVHRVFSVPIVHSKGNRSIRIKMADKQRARNDMATELREDYGVHKVTPVNVKSYEQTYSDIKQRGSMVREKMAAQHETNQKQQKEKQKEWTRKALLRTPARAKEKRERKAREEAAKRRITVSTRPNSSDS